MNDYDEDRYADMDYDPDDHQYDEPLEPAGEWDEATWAREASVLADATLTLANLVRRAMDYQVRVPAIAQATGMHYESLIALMEVSLGDGGRVLGVDMASGAPAPLHELRAALPHGWLWATARGADGTVLVQLAGPAHDGRCPACLANGIEDQPAPSPWTDCECGAQGEDAGWSLTWWQTPEEALLGLDDHLYWWRLACERLARARGDAAPVWAEW